jgi:hypothetical protein
MVVLLGILDVLLKVLEFLQGGDGSDDDDPPVEDDG